ncbi:hypothetical protein Tco_0679083 [Tanacetum coccineum]|uniref:Uncharacterized protein n=1 Tax=Tanacetum coccineum TaxID=301880 RepID=A0ABQ4XGW1_9ASTR
MAALKSCPKHNMIAYLEKTDANTEFHEIMDFLTQSSIYYAFTLSPVVSTTFVKHFWMSAKSKTINNVRYITATVAGNPVTILEASIRSDLLFDDADGIDTLNNQAIFDTIQLMGHLDAKKKFVMYPRFILIFLATQLTNVLVPLDHFPIHALTSKVLSFMVKKGKNFSGNVTPLFDSMLVQPTEDEDEASERPSESQTIPSPPHPSEDQPESQSDPSLRPSLSIPIPDSNPEGSGRDHGGQSSSDRSLSGNEDGLTLQSVYDLCGRKTAKSKPTAHKDQAFDDFDNLDYFDAMDYMETEDAHNEKGIDEGTAELKNENSDENATSTATPTVFGDDETITEFLVSMSQNKAKQKGVKIKDAEDFDRPRPTSTRSLLTLKPLPEIDPKDKGKKVLKEEAESDVESEGVNEAERKFAQLANDEEIARKARIEADSILAARLQEEEREKFTTEERAKLLHETIAAQRRFLAQQRAAEIRSRPPTRTQLRNQMMTYLKHVGGKKNSDLKTKNFEEI